MSPEQSFQVAGVDGCKAGWFIATTSVTMENEIDTYCEFNLKNVFIASTFTEVLSETTDCKLVCVDIPIGLSDRDRRRCDEKAKEILGNRQYCVFFAPIRPILSYKRYPTANRISRCLSSHGLSRQSFNIMELIRQVDYVMTPPLQKRIRETHPEVCFWALNHEQPMQHKKKSEEGQKERIGVLATIFPNVKEIVAKDNRPRGVKVDDILDALVAAYTAGQAALNKVKRLPEKPEKPDSNGLRMEIVYPA